ncbi:MAG TPA: CoB--CoM heterodisulfide reductase iron-sulfur subunit B family protein [Anaerolineae bacterium]|jgi:heterodisulfide reductase subunit B|nr:CoB--CoM heterodisulfide reductase iron-sulfur subunit B family protein [Anaerolineae bacterium]
MPIPYYPGCTLSTKARGYDASGRDVAKALGLELAELEDWNCCGATFPLAVDNLLAMAGPTKVLVEARAQGERVATLCAICYNVLKRTNHFLQSDDEKRDRLNYFIEAEYAGDLRVEHFLQILRDELGFEELQRRVEQVKSETGRTLAGLRVAPYYGCLLLRPEKEMQLDDAEDPRVFEDLLTALGCDPVDFSHRTECCGSYLLVTAADIAADMSYEVLRSASSGGAELLVTACPLCQYNLDYRQSEMARQHPGFKPLPVLYFTQLMGLALGLDSEEWGWELQRVDARPLLAERGLL